MVQRGQYVHSPLPSCLETAAYWRMENTKPGSYRPSEQASLLGPSKDNYSSTQRLRFCNVSLSNLINASCCFLGISLNEECKLKGPRRLELAQNSVINSTRRQGGSPSSPTAVPQSARGQTDELPGTQILCKPQMREKSGEQRNKTRSNFQTTES